MVLAVWIRLCPQSHQLWAGLCGIVWQQAHGTTLKECLSRGIQSADSKTLMVSEGCTVSSLPVQGFCSLTICVFLNFLDFMHLCVSLSPSADHPYKMSSSAFPLHVRAESKGHDPNHWSLEPEEVCHF